MNLVLFDINEDGVVRDQSRVSLVDEACNELGLVVGHVSQSSANANNTVDIRNIEVSLLSDDTDPAIQRALQVALSIAVRDANCVIGLVAINHADMSDL